MAAQSACLDYEIRAFECGFFYVRHDVVVEIEWTIAVRTSWDRAKGISQFFSDLGYPLRNVRWSWGARQSDAILLRTWDDEYTFKEWKLRVLEKIDLDGQRDSFGLDEHIFQLKALWNGGLAGYTVIATAKDRHANSREIAAYLDDVVLPLTRLESTPNGGIIAIVF